MVGEIGYLGYNESEVFRSCSYCGGLVEVGRKKEGIWHKGFPGGPSRIYHKECLKKIVNLHGE